MTEHCLTKKIVTLLKLLYMINIYCCLCQEPFLLNYFTHWFYSLVLLFFILLFFVSVVTLLFNSRAFFSICFLQFVLFCYSTLSNIVLLQCFNPIFTSLFYSIVLLNFVTPLFRSIFWLDYLTPLYFTIVLLNTFTLLFLLKNISSTMFLNYFTPLYFFILLPKSS